MKVIADLHLHSKYSRAVSGEMVFPKIAEWARLKGIDLLGTGDFTHPLWVREAKVNLEETGEGVYQVKGTKGPKFIFSTEIASIYNQGGKTRRIHNIVLAPGVEVAEKINKELAGRGANLMSDGRPITGIPAADLVKLILSVDENCLIIPAHCLLPDTCLEVNPGIRKIKDIKVGDKVLTHNGRYRRVKEIFTRDYHDEVFKVRPWYFTLGLTTTPEHPFLAIKTFKKCKSTGDICRPVGRHLNHCVAKHHLAYKKEWIEVSKLEPGDVILFPRLRKISDKKFIEISNLINKVRKERGGKVSFGGRRKTLIPDKIPVDAGFLRLVGYYLAEGYTGGDNISFAFHGEEVEIIDDIKAQIRRLFGISHFREYKRKKGTNSIELICHSKVIAKLFSELFYEPDLPRRAHTKRLPFWMLYLSLIKQKEILKAWWLGDKGYTNSRVLLNQMKTICLRLGIIPSVRVDTKEEHRLRGKHDKFEGREIRARHDNFSIDKLNFIDDKLGICQDPVFSRFKTKLERRHGWMDEDFAYIPIRKIERFFYEGEVYNLEVEEDNSYTSEFATVHNCWTPWFSLYGSESGFDSIKECFGEEEKFIYAIETGLSSSPEMNWRIKELDSRQIISFSDAHSGPKLGREATVFEISNQRLELSYELIREAIIGELGSSSQPLKARIASTIEFFPEEGKYHYTGHRNCNVRHSPEETKKLGVICPVCGRRLTVGVMHRVQQLASRELKTQNSKLKIDEFGVRQIGYKERPPYVMMVPLLEILSESFGVRTAGQSVLNEYKKLTDNFGGEFRVLLATKEDDIARIAGPKVAEGIKKVRSGEIVVDPGYDGVFGTVKIWPFDSTYDKPEEKKEQLALF